MSSRHHVGPANIALIAVFAALIAACTLAPEITMAGGIPLSLQTFGVVLTALVLGPWRGGAAVGLYLVVGLAGAPIFANLRSGPAVFAGPTGGYLVGMLAASVVVGLIVLGLRRRRRLTTAWLTLAGLASLPVVYAFGVPWLSLRLGLPLLRGDADCQGLFDMSEECLTGLTVGIIPFLPGDVLKVIAAAVVAAIVHRAFPQLLPPVTPASIGAVDDTAPASA